MEKKLNDFYNTNIKDLLPDKFWHSYKLNMLLDMFNKSEDDDFTIGEMFGIISNELPLCREGFMVNKLNDVLYWLACAPALNKISFFDIKTEDYCNYLTEKLGNQNLLKIGGADGILPLRDEFFSFTKNNDDELISIETDTLGELINGLKIVIDYYDKTLFVDERAEIEYAEICSRALDILSYIFFNPYYYLLHKK